MSIYPPKPVTNDTDKTNEDSCFGDTTTRNPDNPVCRIECDFYTECGEKNRAAKEAKDKKRMKELDAKGPALQNLMRQQVFGNLSIPNVLRVVSDRLPTLAANAGVSLLVSKWEIQYSTSEIERVDLTPQLVELFDVDDATARIIDESLKRAVEPVPIEQLLDPRD